MDRSKVAAGMALALSLTACGSDEPSGEEVAYSLQFAGRVSGEPFLCNTTYAGIGNPPRDIEALDFRFYLYDVTLISADGTEHPLTLTQDQTWQRDNVAFLDFEDGTGKCETGSPATRTVVEGTAPEMDYTGVKFTVGIPAAMNHLDAATAPAPFNIPGMWWSWGGGYKYMRIEVATAANPAYYWHHGATNCSGDVSAGFACQFDNLATITLDNFDPATDRIAFDLATFYQDSNLEQPQDYVTDFVSGCMAFSGDPECPTLFGKLGLMFEDAEGTSPQQSVFTVEKGE